MQLCGSFQDSRQMEFSNDFFDHERDNKQFLSYEA